ncbi:MAG: UDP-N-acetylmuramate--L-alanine ligase [Bacteroidota bacterium]
MTNLNHITQICFLGIGGAGMSALAGYFHSRGVSVCGYDKTPGPLTKNLEEQGITVIYEDDPAMLNITPELVIYTPAVPATTRLFQHFSNSGTPVIKRAEVLGMLSKETPTIAIAGTHGKTTITTMLAHIMKTAGIPCLAFLGGVSTNYNTNYIGDPDPEWLIAEADEYDRSFLHLNPSIAVISSIDNDHLDVYGSRQELQQSFAGFARKLLPGGTLIAKKGVVNDLHFTGKHFTYHPKEKADYYLENIQLEQGYYTASVRGRLHINNFRVGHPGWHNLENALGASALAHLAGVDRYDIEEGLKSFLGVKRRFELRYQDEHNIYIDDYAHHPEEIRACILSAREIWPGKKITGIFQPHLFSRTRDLADQFAESLSLPDELILLDIYPAREAPIEGVDAGLLLDKVSGPHAMHCSREELPEIIRERDTEVLLTMGAGDIGNLAETITAIIKQKALL